MAGGHGKPVTPGLKVSPKPQGVKQRVRSRGKEVTRGSPRWPGGCRVGGGVGGRAAAGAGGVDVGTGTAPSTGNRLTREVVSLPSTTFPGQRGSGARACGLETPLTSAGPCWDGQSAGPCPDPAARLAPSWCFHLPCSGELPLQRGHKSSSASTSSKSHQGAPGSPPAATKTAQPHCTPHLPFGAQGLSSGCQRYRAEGFQAVSHQLNGINS